MILLCPDEFGAPLILHWILLDLGVADRVQRTATLGIDFVFYFTGETAKPYSFLVEEMPKYPTALKRLLGSYRALIVFQTTYAALRFHPKEDTRPRWCTC